MAASRRDRHQRAKQFLSDHCRNLAVDDVDWATASPPSRSYNCFGFVMGPVGDRLRWWQPHNFVDGTVTNPTDYWPENVPHETTVAAFIEAAKTRGFFVAADAAWDEGFETIAIYFDSANEFKHAARQKSPGVWESKLGPDSDIEHPKDGIDNIWYGEGRVFMKREWPYPRNSLPASDVQGR